MQRHFDAELSELSDQLLTIGSHVEAALARAMHALVERDVDEAKKVIEADRVIDVLEVEIEQACLTLLARFQPEAKDLRFVTMALKINNDLERMGDLASNIAKRSLELQQEPQLKPLIDLPRMAEIVQGMVHGCLDAFVRRDADLAREICTRDDSVDQLNVQIFRELVTFMLGDPSTIQRALSLLNVSRQLERMGDLATNISEDVVYLVEGKVIKHNLSK